MAAHSWKSAWEVRKRKLSGPRPCRCVRCAGGCADLAEPGARCGSGQACSTPRHIPRWSCSRCTPRRWEQEIAYRELKVDLRAGGDSPLASHTPDTAAQEIAALLVAMTMVARARLQVAQAAGTTPLLVSFGRTLAALQPLWMLLSVGGDLLSAAQQRGFIDRVLTQLAGRLLPAKRRERGCVRGVRQPVKSWPRVHQTQQSKGAYQYELTSTAE